MQTLRSVQIALAIVGWLLLALLVLLVLVLVVPTHLELRGILNADRVDGAADLRWGPGLLALHAAPAEGVVLRVLGLRVGRLRGGRGKKEEPRARPPRKRKGRSRFTLRAGLRLLRRALRSLRLRARLAGRVGLGDPAATARLWGFLQAASGLTFLDLSDLRVDWLEPVVDLDGRLRLRVRPIAIAWIAAGEAWRSRRKG